MHASTADSATTAVTAESAKKDGSGNIIADTYATKTELGKATTVKVDGGENINTGSGIELIAGKNIALNTSGNKVTITSLGGTDAQAVHYDIDAKDSVTLGGPSATTAVARKNAALVANSQNEFTFLDKNGTTDEKVTLKNVAIESTAIDPETGGSGAQVADGEIRQTTVEVVEGQTITKTVEIKGGDVIVSALADDGVKYVKNDSVTTNLITLDKQVTMIDADKSKVTDYSTQSARAAGENSTAVGYNTKTTEGAAQSTAVGYNNVVTGANSTAIGTGNVITGEASGAFGDPSVINGSGTYSVGNNNYIDGNNTFAIGSNIGTAAAPVKANNSVILGAGSNAKGDNEVSVGNADTGLTRKITNIASGSIAQGSTDAVTDGQLYDTNTRVTSVEQQMAETGKEVKEVGAMSATLAGLHYVEPSGEGETNSQERLLMADTEAKTRQQSVSHTNRVRT